MVTPALLTITEFSEWPRLGRTKIYDLLAAQELAAIKVGRRTFIPYSAAQQWLDAQKPY